MSVLVIGSGGREHALAGKLSASPLVDRVYLWPGNAGVPLNCSGISLVGNDIGDHGGIVDFCLSRKIDLAVIGPEVALAAGLADKLRHSGVKTLGPSQVATQLESSKYFAKKIMEEAQVPTAPYATFTSVSQAQEFIQESPWGESEMVVKADTLAAGKGVVVCSSRDEANAAALHLGEGGKRIIIERKLKGREVSAFALCDGTDFVSLGYASDYKRIFDGDRGPNTGGMGAISPVSWITEEYKKRIDEGIFSKLLKVMREKGQPFQGILFAGLMIDEEAAKGDDIYVLEFNVRFGDPETQVLLPLIDEDLYPWFSKAAEGNISSLSLTLPGKGPRIKEKAAVHVVMAAHGYPSPTVRSGDPVDVDPHLLEKNIYLGDETQIFFAGVKQGVQGLVTGGGRVLGVTALGSDLQEARERAYLNINKISFSGAQNRLDIGAEPGEREAHEG